MRPSEQKRDITVQINSDFKKIHVHPVKLRRLVRAVCNRFRLRKAAVSIAIVDDRQLRRLNRRFLNRRSTSDCLSFDLSDGGAESGRTFELVVNGEMAVRQAGARGHCPEAELALYVTHALLHNLGFNDCTAGQAKKMHDTEDQLLQELGYGLVYDAGGK